MSSEEPSVVVSVVIPCFNQARFLRDALVSLAAQRYSGHEVVVVDDGSTDDPAGVTREFGGVRCLRQANRGTAVARNHGLRESRGCYVVFLDADDRLTPDAMRVGVEALDREPRCGLVYGHVRLFGSESDLSACRCPAQTAVTEDHYHELLRRNYVWSPGAAMYRRTALVEVGGFDPRARGSADFDLNVRIASRWPIRCHGQTVLDYREHSASQSSDPAYMLRSAVSVRRRHRRASLRANEKRALAAGIRTVQADYGERLLDRMAELARAGAWRAALRCLPPLLHYYPAGVVRRTVRRLRRP